MKDLKKRYTLHKVKKRWIAFGVTLMAIATATVVSSDNTLAQDQNGLYYASEILTNLNNNDYNFKKGYTLDEYAKAVVMLNNGITEEQANQVVIPTTGIIDLATLKEITEVSSQEEQVLTTYNESISQIADVTAVPVGINLNLQTGTFVSDETGLATDFTDATDSITGADSETDAFLQNTTPRTAQAIADSFDNLQVGEFYHSKLGDTLTGISEATGLSIADLREINDFPDTMTDSTILPIGTQILRSDQEKTAASVDPNTRKALATIAEREMVEKATKNATKKIGKKASIDDLTETAVKTAVSTVAELQETTNPLTEQQKEGITDEVTEVVPDINDTLKGLGASKAAIKAATPAIIGNTVASLVNTAVAAKNGEIPEIDSESIIDNVKKHAELKGKTTEVAQSIGDSVEKPLADQMSENLKSAGLQPVTIDVGPDNGSADSAVEAVFIPQEDLDKQKEASTNAQAVVEAVAKSEGADSNSAQQVAELNNTLTKQQNLGATDQEQAETLATMTNLVKPTNAKLQVALAQGLKSVVDLDPTKATTVQKQLAETVDTITNSQEQSASEDLATALAAVSDAEEAVLQADSSQATSVQEIASDLTKVAEKATGQPAVALAANAADLAEDALESKSGKLSKDEQKQAQETLAVATETIAQAPKPTTSETEEATATLVEATIDLAQEVAETSKDGAKAVMKEAQEATKQSSNTVALELAEKAVEEDKTLASDGQKIVDQVAKSETIAETSEILSDTQTAILANGGKVAAATKVASDLATKASSGDITTATAAVIIGEAIVDSDSKKAKEVQQKVVEPIAEALPTLLTDTKKEVKSEVVTAETENPSETDPASEATVEQAETAEAEDLGFADLFDNLENVTETIVNADPKQSDNTQEVANKISSTILQSSDTPVGVKAEALDTTMGIATTNLETAKKTEVTTASEQALTALQKAGEVINQVATSPDSGELPVDAVDEFFDEAKALTEGVLEAKPEDAQKIAAVTKDMATAAGTISETNPEVATEIIKESASIGGKAVKADSSQAKTIQDMLTQGTEALATLQQDGAPAEAVANAADDLNEAGASVAKGDKALATEVAQDTATGEQITENVTTNDVSVADANAVVEATVDAHTSSDNEDSAQEQAAPATSDKVDLGKDSEEDVAGEVFETIGVDVDDQIASTITFNKGSDWTGWENGVNLYAYSENGNQLPDGINNWPGIKMEGADNTYTFSIPNKWFSEAKTDSIKVIFSAVNNDSNKIPNDGGFTVEKGQNYSYDEQNGKELRQVQG